LQSGPISTTVPEPSKPGVKALKGVRKLMEVPVRVRVSEGLMGTKWILTRSWFLEGAREVEGLDLDGFTVFEEADGFIGS